jgi:uracil-DNA glycosylase
VQPSKHVKCEGFPCVDVRHKCYVVPGIAVSPEAIFMIMVSEAAPDTPDDYYYARGKPLFEQTTVQAFNDAGVKVASIKELVACGIYLTTAVKCGKTGYGIETNTVRICSLLLEKELALFPEARALMLMGDIAIKSINFIAQRAGEKRVIPAGSTYKLRSQEYSWRGKRVFPSYLQAGPSFFIEKSKRRMIAEDIAAAMEFAQLNKE